jgi:hypothetical protein
METSRDPSTTDPQELRVAESKPSPRNEISDVKTSTVAKIFPLRNQKSTGPTSKVGKERSKRNAVKHGIFAKVVVLENEPLAQFDSLLRGFRNDLRPKGSVEEILVEKLASLTWRYRRMLVAERAEIRAEQYSGWRLAAANERDREEALLLATSEVAPKLGLLARWENPLVRSRCIALLKTLYKLMERRGFDPAVDSGIIGRCYGLPASIELITFYNFYSSSNDSIRKEIGSEYDLPKEERVRKFLDFVQESISHLEEMDKKLKSFDVLRERQERTSASVPEPARLDRLLKYSASLERDFDRTLNQLERLQRIRTGQPVPPQLNVNISS